MHREGRSIPPPEQDQTSEAEQSNMSRRGFLKGVLGAAGVAIGGGAAREGYRMATPNEVAIDTTKESWDEILGPIKERLIEEISDGIQGTAEAKALTEEHNAMIPQLKALEKDDPAYKELLDKKIQLMRHIREVRPTRWTGGSGAAPFEIANAYAKKLLADDAALTNLALLRHATITQRPTIEFVNERALKDLEYWHNHAAAYVELGSLSFDDIADRIEAVANGVYERDGTLLAEQQEEDIIYALFDERFDPTLTAEQVQGRVQHESSDWQAMEHANHEKDVHEEAYDQLSVFELNRLQRLYEQLQDEAFRTSLFTERNLDLDERRTELGGVVPVPGQDHALLPLEPRTKKGNDSYSPPIERELYSPYAIGSYHFHATKVEEDANVYGPSGADIGSSLPSVVFTSVDQQHIATHFHVTRWKSKEDYQTIVISLGSVTPPDTMPEQSARIDQNKKEPSWLEGLRDAKQEIKSLSDMEESG